MVTTVNLFHGFDAETDNLCGCITAFISQVVVEITTFIWNVKTQGLLSKSPSVEGLLASQPKIRVLDKLKFEL
jgi:hypothetical protein